MSIAIGYMRYSSAAQGSGSTIARQRDRIQKWVDEQRKDGKFYEVRWYEDRGVSGWDGSNRNAGALGHLINDINSGMYPAETPIIVESVDRITRAGIQETQRILSELTIKGLVVHALLDRQTVSYADLDTLQGVVTVVAYAEKSRAESDLKSERVRAAAKKRHEAARRGEKLMAGHLPGWIYVSDTDGKMKVDPVKKKIVENIYRMRLNGMTFQAIANAMNDEAVPILNERRGAKEWLANSVRTLLRNRSVIGYLPPSKVNKDYGEIEGYFPKAISDKLFYDVQEMNVPAKRGLDRTRPDYPESVYLFKKLIRCKYCLGNVFPNGAKPGYWGRIRCMGHHNKTCQAPPLPRYDLEYNLVTRLFPLLGQMDITAENDPTSELKARIDHLKRQADNLIADLGEANASTRKLVMQQLNKVTEEQDGLEKQLVSVQASKEASAESKLSGLDFNDYQDRLRLQVSVKRVVESILLDSLFDKVHVKLHNGNVLYGFPIYGNNDESITLQKAIQNSPEASEEFKELFGISGGLSTVYVVSGVSQTIPDYDAMGYPPADESDETASGNGYTPEELLRRQKS